MRSDHPGVRKCRRHAVVFEAARGVHALVLQKQAAALQSDIFSHESRVLQQRLPFADGDRHFRRSERQQFAKSPHAAKTKRFVAARPFGFKPIERSERLQPVPIVDHIEQPATVAGHAHVVQAVGRPAVGRNAPLEGKIGFGDDAHERRLRGRNEGGNTSV